MNNNHCDANSKKLIQASDYATGAISSTDEGFKKFVKYFGELDDDAIKKIPAANVFNRFGNIYSGAQVVGHAWNGNYKEAFIESMSWAGGYWEEGVVF